MKNYFYFKEYSNEYIHFGVTSFFFYPNNDWDTQITYPYRNLLTLNKILEKASQIKGYQVKEQDLVNIIFDDDIEEVGCVAIENQNGRSAIMSIDELDMICACMKTINLYTLGLQMLQISIPVFGLLKELKETQLPNKVVGFSKPPEDIVYVNTTANIKPPNSIPDL